MSEMSALDRARALAAAATGAASPAPPHAAAAAPIPDFATPKLKLLTETLEKRCDELSTTLDVAISEIEASALNPRLSGWLGWVAERRRRGSVVLTIGGESIQASFAEVCGTEQRALEGHAVVVAGSAPLLDNALAIAANFSTDLGLIALLDFVPIQRDALVLGSLQRESVGLIWLGARSLLPVEIADVFRESTCGIYFQNAQDDDSRTPAGTGPWYSIAPGQGSTLREIIARLVPKPARRPVAALTNAVQLTMLASTVQSEQARENARLAFQASIAERAKNSRGFVDELMARKDLMTELREDLSRDLQSSIDEITKFIAQVDEEALFRGAVKRAFDAIPGLRFESGKLIYFRHFEVDHKSSWFTGTRWQKFDKMFPHKMEISVPTEEVGRLCDELTVQLVGITSKESKRRVERFNRSIGEFAETASSVGVDVKSAEIAENVRNRWERRPGSASGEGGPARARVGSRESTLEDRTHRVLDATCQKDVKGFNVEIERKGPIGRVMEARTAVMGVSFLVLTGIRVSTWYQNAQNTGVTKIASQQGPKVFGVIPPGQLLNATLVAVLFIFVGLIINAITKEGKEAAVITEKVKSARASLEDKLIGVMGRFLNTELGDVKAKLTEHKATALDRFDRAIEAKKQEIEEHERRARLGGTRLGSRPALPPLPMSLKSDIEKVTVAVRDTRAELASRYAPAPSPAPAPSKTTLPTTTTPRAAVAKAPEPTNPALAALAARVAARKAAAAAAQAEPSAFPSAPEQSASS